MVALNPKIHPGPHSLSQEQANAAWLTLFRHNLDALPDVELRWERSIWADAGVDRLVAVCDALLAERTATSTTIPGGAEAATLDQLHRHVERRAVGRLVEHEALSLVEACRLVFWAGLREVPR